MTLDEARARANKTFIVQAFTYYCQNIFIDRPTKVYIKLFWFKFTHFLKLYHFTTYENNVYVNTMV
jgi:hypothetical protein